MAQEQDSEPFEWVNRWAENAAPAPATLAVTQPIAPVVPDDLLARDIAEIVLRRDALALVPTGFDSPPGGSQRGDSGRPSHSWPRARRTQSPSWPEGYLPS